MHSQTIAVRDLSPNNVVLGTDNKWKILNLGNGTTRFMPAVLHYHREELEDEIDRTTEPGYRAPELLNLYSNYPISEKIDIFALGCLMYFMLF